jgi:hypothetical protein
MHSRTPAALRRLSRPGRALVLVLGILLAPAAARAQAPADPARPGDGARPAVDPPRETRDATAARPAVDPPRRPAVDPPRRPDPEATRPATRPAGKDDDKDEDPPMTQLRGTAWAMVGVTAVLLTVSGVFGLLVEDREDEIERLASFLDATTVPANRPLAFDGRTKRDYEQAFKEGRRYEIAAFTFVGLSAAAAISAVGLFVADHLQKKRRTEAPRRAFRLAPILAPQGAGLAVGGEF